MKKGEQRFQGKRWGHTLTKTKGTLYTFLKVRPPG